MFIIDLAKTITAMDARLDFYEDQMILMERNITVTHDQISKYIEKSKSCQCVNSGSAASDGFPEENCPLDTV